jgi:hypothetical protein
MRRRIVFFHGEEFYFVLRDDGFKSLKNKDLIPVSCLMQDRVAVQDKTYDVVIKFYFSPTSTGERP